MNSCISFIIAIHIVACDHDDVMDNTNCVDSVIDRGVVMVFVHSYDKDAVIGSILAHGPTNVVVYDGGVTFACGTKPAA